MLKSLRALLPKKFLGVDIGTSSVKLVELSRVGYKRRLENYGEIPATVFYEKPFRTFEKTTLFLSDDEIAKAIKAIMEETGIKTKNAVFSIPDFSSFFTTFKLPPMTREELAQAIKYEARQHIPVPLSEVFLDWQIIDTKPFDKEKSIFKVLLVAVPNEIINQYQKIAKTAQLEIFSLEAEVFSLIRALINEEEKKITAVIDIGLQSTTCSIVEKGVLKMSHSFDISDNNLTSTLSKSLDISFVEAENLKKKYGIKKNQDNNIGEILSSLVDLITNEINEVINSFYRQEDRDVEKIIIAGGAASIPGLREYFKDYFKGRETIIGNPFSSMVYPFILEDTLTEIGPSFSIAVGAALRGLQE